MKKQNNFNPSQIYKKKKLKHLIKNIIQSIQNNSQKKIKIL